MKLSHEDLDDLEVAVMCWLEEYTGACSDEALMERMRMLLIRLRVRKTTTKDGE